MAEQVKPAEKPNRPMGNRRRPAGGGRNRRGRRPEAAPKQFEEVVINIDRVARVVKGGRRFRFRALVAVGDKKGKVGVGTAKGADVQTAIAKATDVAKKNMIIVPIDNETIPHEAEIKLSGARVLLKPASQGTGIIAGGVVRSVIELSGVRNLISKSLGSANKVNIAQATMEGLRQMVAPEAWVNPPAKKPAAKIAKPAVKKTEKSEKAAPKATKKAVATSAKKTAKTVAKPAAKAKKPATKAKAKEK